MTDETPWAMVKRLQSEGKGSSTIVEALKQHGLPAEDIELLLRDVPGFVGALPLSGGSRGGADTAAYAGGADFSVGEKVVFLAMQGVLMLGWLAGVIAMVSALCFFYFPMSVELVATFAASAGVCGLAAWGYLRWKDRPEVLPNLAETVDFRHLCEVDGVQFTTAVPVEAQRGEDISVHIRLQNCVNRPRQVSFRFTADGPAAGKGTAVTPDAAWSIPREAGGLLGAGEVAELVLYVRAGPAAAEQLVMWVEPTARGPMARRVRYRTARAYEDRIEADETVAGIVFLGVARWGGGYRIPVTVRGSAPDEVEIHPLPLPKWTVVWTPPAELLRRAAGG